MVRQLRSMLISGVRISESHPLTLPTSVDGSIEREARQPAIFLLFWCLVYDSSGFSRTRDAGVLHPMEGTPLLAQGEQDDGGINDTGMCTPFLLLLTYDLHHHLVHDQLTRVSPIRRVGRSASHAHGT